MISNQFQTLYQTIKQDLMQQIQNGTLSPNDKVPTEQALMTKYQVSRITVSKALGELKNEGILIRYAGKGSFVSPNAMEHLPKFILSSEQIPPSSLHTLGHTNSLPAPHNTNATMCEIACILPYLADQFSLSIVKGFQSAFPSDRYACYIIQSSYPEKENHLLQRCIDIGISGVLLFPDDNPFYSNQILSMKLNNYPLVFIDKQLKRLETSYVISDNQVAGELCFQHLHQLGHSKIAFISSAQLETFTVHYRLMGLKKAMERVSIFPIVECIDTRNPSETYASLIEQMIKEEKITAFISAQSATGLYLYTLISSLGYDIPKDISLITFDNPLADFEQFEFFTYIDQHEKEMGYECGMILRNIIENQDHSIQTRVNIPELKIRKSTGPATL